MFTTVPRPRSEKEKRTIVATTKKGYLEGVLRDSIDFNIPILIKCPQYPKLIRKSD